jgi:hypothetical protein
VIVAALGIVFLAYRRRWTELRFPAILLGTTLAIHAVHRPWWMYYYLHLAVPLAWLAGIAAAQLMSRISHLLVLRTSGPIKVKVWEGIGLCLLLGLAVVRSEGRLEGGVKDMQQRPRVSSSPVIARMKEFAGRTHWVCAPRGTYAFHAGLPILPELAVLSLKRFWSGQITKQQVVDL